MNAFTFDSEGFVCVAIINALSHSRRKVPFTQLSAEWETVNWTSLTPPSNRERKKRGKSVLPNPVTKSKVERRLRMLRVSIAYGNLWESLQHIAVGAIPRLLQRNPKWSCPTRCCRHPECNRHITQSLLPGCQSERRKAKSCLRPLL